MQGKYDLKKLGGYLRNHHKYCAPHHNALVKILPKNMLPPNAEFVSWESVPANKERIAARNRRTGRKKHDDPIVDEAIEEAVDDPMMHNSGLEDEQGR